MGSIYNAEAIGAAAAIAVFIIWLACIGVGIAGYVLRSIGLYDLARKREVRGAWLAWVPGIWIWTLGAVADYHAAQRGIKRRWRWLLPGLYALIMVGYVVLLAAMIIGVFAMEGMGYPSEEMVLGVMGGVFAAYIPMLVGLLAYMPCYYVCIYKVFEETAPEKAVKYLLLSVLVPLAFGICLMRCAGRPVAAAQELPAIESSAEAGFIPQDLFAPSEDRKENQ